VGRNLTAPNDHLDFWTEIVVDAPIGAALFLMSDLILGKGQMLAPEDLIVMLTKADGPPRVATMVVEADDLRNIKWSSAQRMSAPCHNIPCY
jgi:hypothetical protein